MGRQSPTSKKLNRNEQMNNTIKRTSATRELTNIHTIKLAVLDAIEYAEQRGDLNLALAYAALLKKDLDPLIKERLGL